MIDLLRLQPSEAERIAYSEGFTMAAELFARIDALQRAAQTLLGELEVLGDDLDPGIIQAANKLRDEVNQ